MSTGNWVVRAILAALIPCIAVAHHRLTALRNRFKNAFARRADNDAVMASGAKREPFPDNLLAGPFGFEPAARETPAVSFQ